MLDEQKQGVRSQAEFCNSQADMYKQESAVCLQQGTTSADRILVKCPGQGR